MKTPKTVKEAAVLAEQLGCSTYTVMRAFEIVDSKQQEKERKLKGLFYKTNEFRERLEVLAQTHANSQLQDELSNKMLKNTSNSAEMWEIYAFASSGVRIKILRKILKTGNRVDTGMIMKYAPEESQLYFEAFKKWILFTFNKKDLWDLCKSLSNGNPKKLIILERLLKIADNRRDIEDILSYLEGRDGYFELGVKAVRTIAEME